ncbi:MAG TPA: hypothetical protein PKV33_03890 [Methanothrix sp.]|nr:hypothetical protein [Methanothrix sp.]
MGRKIILLLLLIFPISTVAMDNFLEVSFVGLSGKCSISLEGNDSLLMPEMIIPERAGEKLLLDRVPVYSLSRTIKGAFIFPSNQEAFDIYGCISAFDLSSFFSATHAVGYNDKNCSGNYLVLDNGNCSDGSNCRPFRLSTASSGMYLLNLFDFNGSSLIFSVPLLITEGQTIMQAPSIVQADEPFIQVMMNTTLPGNQSKFFAAILISRNDYENASLLAAWNKSAENLDINLSLGSKSMKMKGPLKVTTGLLMDLLPLLPANSAIGLQESTKQGADLILLPDKSWQKGEYILTGAIYSPGKGLLGIKQREVLIV